MASFSNHPTILIVDSTPARLRSLHQLLRGAGYRVRAVTSGVMALTTARSAPPDLVIFQFNLDSITGDEVYEQFSEDTTLKHIPAILLCDTPCHTNVAPAVLQWPFTPADVLSLVSDQLDDT
ncbi:MAG: response regulator [Chloroflexota bacterium]